jgi:hypothetical protein
MFLFIQKKFTLDSLCPGVSAKLIPELWKPPSINGDTVTVQPQWRDPLGARAFQQPTFAANRKKLRQIKVN